MNESIDDFQKQVERSTEHLDLVHMSTRVLSQYQNVWKPKFKAAASKEERKSLLCDLAVFRAKLRIIDEMDSILFPEEANMFREWKAKRRSEDSLEIIYDYE